MIRIYLDITLFSLMTYLGFRRQIAHMRQHMTAYVALRKTFIYTLWPPNPVSLEYIVLKFELSKIIEISSSYLLAKLYVN